MFSEKLNFLIDLTGIKNSELAKAINMDASYISRLRNGNRTLSKNQSYVMPMAKYFAKRITTPFEQKILINTLHFPGEWPNNQGTVAEYIYRWLTDKDNVDQGESKSFFTGFSNEENTFVQPAMATKEKDNSSETLYYGEKGKQTAVKRFLMEVLNEKTPQTLLLFSDENMAWLFDDPAFASEWAKLLPAVIQQGNRIKIIHTTTRDSGDMMEALSRWLPVYMTGAIEPYYYPKLRDGVFQRTIFIAPKTAAIASNSVNQDIEGMLNIYVTDPEGINALTKEYERYLNMCRPLLNILNVTGWKKYFDELSAFEKIKATSIVSAPLPSPMTMPPRLVDVFSEKSSIFRKRWKQAIEQLDHIDADHPHYEIIWPPTKEQIQANAIPIPMADFMMADDFFYTLDQYKEHLKNVLDISTKNPHYHVIVKDGILPGIMVNVKEDAGVIIGKTTSPTVVFTSREPNMVSAFWDYLQRHIINAKKNSQPNGLEKIKELIEEL